MAQPHTLEEVARQYREEGYRVLVRPRGAELPPFLSAFEPDLVASRNGENVVVEVKQREDLVGDEDLPHLAGLVNAEPGWRFDLVVTNARPWADEVPVTATEPGASAIHALGEEAAKLIGLGLPKPAYVAACATLEAAMRHYARREGIPLDRYDPPVVLETLYALGMFSHEEYQRLRDALGARAAVVHGLEPAALPADGPEFLVGMARKLLGCELAAPGSPPA